MVEILTFEPESHAAPWRDFILASYSNPNYVLLSPAYLRWQFLDNPANRSGRHTLWLMLHNGAVVAQLGIVPFRGLAPAGDLFDGAYPINLIVRPEYRIAGLGALLMKRLLETAGLVLNPGVNEAGAAVGTGLGMAELGFLNRYIAIIDGAAARALAQDGRLPESAREAIDPHADRAPADVIAVPRLPEDTPVRFAFPVPAYGAERNRAFLRWRYEAHPAFDYEFLLSADRDSLAVLRAERELSTGAVIVRLVDFLATEKDQAPLLCAVLARARAWQAAFVDFYCSLRCYDDALKEAGFFDEADYPDHRVAALFQPLSFGKTTIRVIASRTDEQNGPAAWYVTKGDSDQDRPNDSRVMEPQPNAAEP